jgi:hypothetical protein
LKSELHVRVSSSPRRRGRNKYQVHWANKIAWIQRGS